MAPFHGMALLLLGIGYLLHAEPLHSERGIGKCPVLPSRPLPPPKNPLPVLTPSCIRDSALRHVISVALEVISVARSIGARESGVNHFYYRIRLTLGRRG